MCDFSLTVVSKCIMIFTTSLMFLSFDQKFAKSKPNPTPMDQQKPLRNLKKNLPHLGPQSLNQLLIPCFGSHGQMGKSAGSQIAGRNRASYFRIVGLVKFPKNSLHFPCLEIWLKLHFLLEGSQVWQKIKPKPDSFRSRIGFRKNKTSSSHNAKIKHLR